MRMLVIKDGKVIQTFKDEQEYMMNNYLAPLGSFIRWETGRWSVRGKWGYTPDSRIPATVRAVAMLED